MERPSKAAPPGHEVDTSKAMKISNQTADAGITGKARKAFSKDALEELGKTLPPFEKALITTPLKATPHSRLARMVLCIKDDVPSAQEEIATSFTKRQWADMVIHTPPNDDKRRSFSANSERFRVNGTLLQGDFPECLEKTGHSKLTLSFQERQPAPASRTILPTARMKKF